MWGLFCTSRISNLIGAVFIIDRKGEVLKWSWFGGKFNRVFSGAYEIGLVYFLFICGYYRVFCTKLIAFVPFIFLVQYICSHAAFSFWYLQRFLVSIHLIMLKPCWNVDGLILLIVNLGVFTICKKHQSSSSFYFMFFLKESYVCCNICWQFMHVPEMYSRKWYFVSWMLVIATCPQ